MKESTEPTSGESLTVTFSDKKCKRTCDWLVRQFAREKGLVLPKSQEEYIAIFKERGLGTQYRDEQDHVYFPTEQGWKAFLDFIDTLQWAEPFKSRSTYNDVFQSFSAAFANILSARLLPEQLDDLTDYLPADFIRDVTTRSERTFSKLNGIHFDANLLLRIGQGWIGTFGLLSFDFIEDDERKWREFAIESLAQTYEAETPVIAGSCNQGTRDRAKKEHAFQCELALSVLDVLLNMTYEDSFNRLWQLRRVERPEHGLSRQLSFSFVYNGANGSSRELSLSKRSSEQLFTINEEIVNRWYDSLSLNDINRIVGQNPDCRTDLGNRLINSLLYFRQATLQPTAEMQMSTLWICVESFFTADNDQIIKANLPALLAMTVSSLRKEYWPNGAGSVDELERVFLKHYGYRSRTFHHGRRGHVTSNEVQQFSIVVSNLIIGITQMIRMGFESPESLVSASKQYVRRLT